MCIITKQMTASHFPLDLWKIIASHGDQLVRGKIRYMARRFRDNVKQVPPAPSFKKLKKPKVLKLVCFICGERAEYPGHITTNMIHYWEMADGKTKMNICYNCRHQVVGVFNNCGGHINVHPTPLPALTFLYYFFSTGEVTPRLKKYLRDKDQRQKWLWHHDKFLC
jgi:hypothetical protein